MQRQKTTRRRAVAKEQQQYKYDHRQIWAIHNLQIELQLMPNISPHRGLEIRFRIVSAETFTPD
eukprot:5183798-Pyramimonas_sp.AAC.1